MKRFWKQAGVAGGAEGWQVTLDGRAVKTQGGRPQVVPTAALAAALAAEWDGQPEEIDPARFVLRDLADYALDVIAADPAPVANTLLGYAETDTLCYRGDPGEALTRRQEADWEPLLAAAEARHGVRFVRVAGIIHRPQPPETRARLGEVLAALDPFTLAALQTLTSLAASLVIGLAALEPEADLPHLWNAANLEEDWQAELWGKDAEAEARRERRRATFLAAAGFARLARG
ncbi:MAG: molecular chaperone [Sphingomonadales bacterium]|nr:molecular chaperone [Sphingomonadales bacterium]